MKFTVTYPDGTRAVCESSCKTVEAFANEHFGSAWAPAQERGATIVGGEPEPTPEVAPEPEVAKPVTDDGTNDES